MDPRPRFSNPALLPTAGPDGEERRPEAQLSPGGINQLLLHRRADRLPRAARDPLVERRGSTHRRDSEPREPLRRAVGDLEIQHDPATTAGERRCTVSDDLSGLGHLRHRIGGQDRVDLGRETVFGRVGLYEADVAPAIRLDPVPGAGEHRVGQIDADDPATGSDRLLDQREVQAGATGDVDDRVTVTKTERLQQRAGAAPAAGIRAPGRAGR